MITGYNVTMPDQSNTVVVTPTAYWPNYKKPTVNGAEVKSGAAHPVQLNPGASKIEILVTGSDDSMKTCTVQIQK